MLTNADPTGTNSAYWLGQDGNLYLKSSAIQGVQNMGSLQNSGFGYAGPTESFDISKFTGSPSYVTAGQISDPAVQSTSTPSTIYSAPASGSGGSTPQNADFINQAYNTKIGGLKSIFDTLNPQQNSAEINVQNQYQNQANALQGQQAQGQRNLNLATDQIQQAKARNLDDLRRQLSTMGMSYANQLGAFGAGDSSAAGMINQALGSSASRNRASVMQQAGNQQQMIDAQGNDLQTEFQNNMKSLDDWKSSSLNDIASRFMQQKQAIQQQMIGANADRYQALAAADANYTNNAISQLAALEQTYKQNANDLVGQYQSIMAPQGQINPNLLQYSVQPMNPSQLSALQTVPSLNTNTNPTPLAMRRPLEQDLGLSLMGA